MEVKKQLTFLILIGSSSFSARCCFVIIKEDKKWVHLLILKISAFFLKKRKKEKTHKQPNQTTLRLVIIRDRPTFTVGTGISLCPFPT